MCFCFNRTLKHQLWIDGTPPTALRFFTQEAELH